MQPNRSGNSVIDVYSRYVVGWMIATRESAKLAEQLLADTIAKQHISRDRLTIHADRGSSMAPSPSRSCSPTSA